MKACNVLVILFLLLTAKHQAQIKKDSILQTIDVFQNDMNNEYADSTHSPLTREDRLKFKGHDFYPINLNLVVVANLKVTPGQEIFEMPTTTERKPKYVKYGEITFKVKRKKYKLNVYQSMDLLNKPEYKDYLFLPFKDLTSGTTSYGGGRYIDLNATDAKRIIVDFNKAYNPYCAYNHKYSCPIPPKENFLNLKVEAGIKAPKE
ncbi:MAG: DUF1684 domain-containing protein [Bacteroidia bacterium]|nr:DUF1684 domain-containing protein [Bacteroidia bacterium]